MKRLVSAALAVAFLGFAAPSEASAQIMLGVAGGVTFPTSDYGDYADTGWLGHVDVGIPVGSNGLGVGASGFYGSNNHSDVDGDKTNLYGAAGTVSYNLPTSGAVSPFVFGLAGLMVHSYKSEDFPDFEDSESGFMWGGGAGFGFPLGGVGGVVRGWYVSANIGEGDNNTTALFGVDLGIQITTGNGM